MSDDKSHLETVAEMKLFFSSGVIGNINLYWVPGFANRDGCTKHLNIIGTEGRYRTSFTTSQVEVYRGNTFLNRLRGPYDFVPKFVAHPEMPLSPTSFRKELESFVNSVLRGSQPEISGAAGVEAIKVVEAAYSSIREKRIVSLEEV
jgi:UDP-N-acetylglucosamine 3-dehydrogenase